MLTLDFKQFTDWTIKLRNDGIELKEIELIPTQYDELLRSVQCYMIGCLIDGSPGEWFKFQGVTIRRRPRTGDIPLVIFR